MSRKLDQANRSANDALRRRPTQHDPIHLTYDHIVRFCDDHGIVQAGLIESAKLQAHLDVAERTQVYMLILNAFIQHCDSNYAAPQQLAAWRVNL